MHKGVILLVEADNREDAYSEAERFLDPYGDGRVWDYWRLGGEWHNTFAPRSKLEEFEKWLSNEYTHIFERVGANSLSMWKQYWRTFSDADKNKIQRKWDSLGLLGENPLHPTYGLDSWASTEDYNIVPLEDCIGIVKEWLADVDYIAKEHWDAMIREGFEGDMSAYYAARYSEVSYRNFSLQSCVFNTVYNESESIPEDIEDFYAVVIDMYN